MKPEDALKILRLCEWAAQDDGENARCPVCCEREVYANDGYVDPAYRTHKPDCALSQLIRDTEAAIQPAPRSCPVHCAPCEYGCPDTTRPYICPAREVWAAPAGETAAQFQERVGVVVAPTEGEVSECERLRRALQEIADIDVGPSNDVDGCHSWCKERQEKARQALAGEEAKPNG